MYTSTTLSAILLLSVLLASSEFLKASPAPQGNAALAPASPWYQLKDRVLFGQVLGVATTADECLKLLNGPPFIVGSWDAELQKCYTSAIAKPFDGGNTVYFIDPVGVQASKIVKFKLTTPPVKTLPRDQWRSNLGVRNTWMKECDVAQETLTPPITWNVECFKYIEKIGSFVMFNTTGSVDAKMP